MFGLAGKGRIGWGKRVRVRNVRRMKTHLRKIELATHWIGGEDILAAWEAVGKDGPEQVRIPVDRLFRLDGDADVQWIGRWTEAED